MKHDLIKFHNWLMQSTFKCVWFEENIKTNIISILSWAIYPEYRSNNSLYSLLGKNKLFTSVLGFVLLWSVTFYAFGRLTATEQKVFIVHKSYNNPQTKILNFDSLQEERRYIEYLAHDKYKIKNYQSLQKLPDEIFFTIVSEIERNELPPSIFFRLLDQESCFEYVYNKSTNAEGWGQILPSTKTLLLKRIGSTNHPLIDNIRMSSEHLKMQYDKHRSEGMSEKSAWLESLKDYNGGNQNLAIQNMCCYTSRLIKKGG